MKLCEALSFRKRQIKMSFEELCASSGVPVSSLKKIFTGVVANPPFETIRAIAHAMGLTTDELVELMEEEKASSGLSPAAIEFARRYDRLDDHSKLVVEAVIDIELKRQITYASEVERFNELDDAVDALIESNA